jgi:hypothetical protein
VVLVVLIGAVVLFYQSGVRGANDGAETVGKPVISIKSPPVSDAKPITEDGQELQVYNQEKGQGPAVSGKPAFAPPPEEPGARPLVQADTPPTASVAPPAPKPATTATQSAPPVATPAPQAPTKAAVLAARAKADPIGEILSPETAARPAKVATAKPAVEKPVPAKAAPAKLAKAKPAVEKPAKALAASAPLSGVSVQFGAFSSPAIAEAEFAKTKAKFGSFTAGRAKHVEKTEVSGKTFYRAAFTGFTKPQAKAFCEALIAAKGQCIIR